MKTHLLVILFFLCATNGGAETLEGTATKVEQVHYVTSFCTISPLDENGNQDMSAAYRPEAIRTTAIVTDEDGNIIRTYVVSETPVCKGGLP